MARRLLSIGECMVEMASTGGDTFRQGFAGDTFNTAWHARRALGDEWEVAYFTAVGDDAVSDRMLDFMAAERIATDYVRRLPGRMPGLYLIELRDGERSFVYWRDSSAARALADDAAALDAAVEAADAVFVSGITLAILAPERRATLLAALDRARRRGAVVAFDSNLRPRLWPDRDAMRAAVRRAAGCCSLALPTIPDETDLFDEAGAEAVAERYLGDGAAEVVVRAGGEAALVVWPEGRDWIAPEAVRQPVDTTGAGDSFDGAYLAARLSGLSPPEAVRAGHDCAARVIGEYGALV